MNVVLLCGGLGTRLREETDFKPKAMVAIGDRPIAWHIMQIFAHYGHKDFVLCLGYKGEMLKKYFLNFDFLNHDVKIKLGTAPKVEILDSNPADNWSVTLVDTGASALKGARLKRIEKHIQGDTFMVTYGDGVADIDLEKLAAFHKQHGKIATVTGVHSPSRFGELVVDKETVKLFTEKPQTSKGLINGGFFVFDRKIFDYLSDDDGCDLERGPLEKLAEEGQLMMFPHQGTWECMDTLRDVEHLNKLWNENNAFWKVWENEVSKNKAARRPARHS